MVPRRSSKTERYWRSSFALCVGICSFASAQVPKFIKSSSCQLPRKPDAALWNELKMDDYIRNYPNGQNLSVTQFAEHHGAHNFLCGIGEKCNAGEFCHPIQGQAWYVLYAIQEWNMFVNSIYMAVATTMDLVRGTTASLLMDLTDPHDHTSHYDVPMFILTLLGAFCVSLSLGVFSTFVTIASTSSWLSIFALNGFLGLGATLSFTGIQATTIIEQGRAVEPSAFSKWSRFGYFFSQWEDTMHQGITRSVNATLYSPISSTGPEGLLQFIGNGTFFQSHPKKTSAQLELSFKDVTQIRALVILLRSMNAFITRASGPCTGRGLNGAWDGDDCLSYCGPDKVLMNVIIADGKHAKNKLYNAKAIALKYNITTEYLTVKSWECQQKHGRGADPYVDTAMPMDVTAECVANLPVCDCSQSDIQKAIKKHGTVRACREVGKLPI